jgi:hypothetical protein
MTVQDDYEALLQWRTEKYNSGRDWWEPGVGGSVALSRIVLHSGGFIEFPLKMTNCFFYWPPTDQTRGALSFTVRKTQEDDSATYLATGYDFLPNSSDPGPENIWNVGVGFTPNIVALEITGPCMLEDLIFERATEPVIDW